MTRWGSRTKHEALWTQEIKIRQEDKMRPEKDIQAWHRDRR